MEKQQAEKICICGDCPTYVDCDEPLAFCMYEEGKSRCITEERGCICPACPVHKSSGFQFDFYCTGGSEQAQQD